MTTALYTHSDCRAHVTPFGHPEQVARLEFIEAALSGPGFELLDRRQAPLSSEENLLLCHPRNYVDRIRNAIPPQGSVALDADTHVVPGSFDAALRAVGAATAAVDAVLAGEIKNAFIATRPPGHHAETKTPMGFCLFGNVAIAAKHALKSVEKVAVVDFDVHHGNGTQDLLWNDNRCLFVSSHQMPLWPGSGSPSERGGHENVINLPLAPGTDGMHMRQVYESHVFPAIETFDPDLVLVSAGFDAHRADPLAQLNWATQDFAWLGERLGDVAEKCCEGRLVSALEGGYDLNALAASVAAFVSVLMSR